MDPNPLLKALSNPMAANTTPKMTNTMPLVDPLPLPVAMSACPGWFGSYRTSTVSPWYKLQPERTMPGSLADRCCVPTWKAATGSQVCELLPFVLLRVYDIFSATMVPLADALNDFGIFALCIATTPRTAAPMPTSANTSPNSFDVVDPPAKDIPDWKSRAPYE